MGVSSERFLDVTRHADVDGAVDVVPFHVETDNNLGVPIGFDVVMFFEGMQQVQGMFFAHVANEEIVDDQGELDGTACMKEQAWGELGLGVALDGQAFAEDVVGNASCLFETVHATVDLDVSPGLQRILLLPPFMFVMFASSWWPVFL